MLLNQLKRSILDCGLRIADLWYRFALSFLEKSKEFLNSIHLWRVNRHSLFLL